ncbi:MAG TPA: hypothetical protein P5049_06580 [Methanothrix sp.]|nr:hypothetical protein [Methanothrix sp.]
MTGGAEALGEGASSSRLVAPESPRFVSPERSMGLSRPANSTRISPSPSRVISPRTIGRKKAALFT